MIKKALFTACALSVLYSPAMALPSADDDRNINVPTSENPVVRKLESFDVPKQQAISIEPQAKQPVFATIDADKNGAVSREEFNATGDAAKFATVDADNSGSISEVEFNNYFNAKEKK